MTYGAEQERFATVEDTQMRNVRCPQCLEIIPAPYTSLGRYLWTQNELAIEQKAYCPNCQLTSLLPTPRVPLEGGEVVLQALDLFIEATDQLAEVDREAQDVAESLNESNAPESIQKLRNLGTRRAEILQEIRHHGNETARLRREQLAR